MDAKQKRKWFTVVFELTRNDGTQVLEVKARDAIHAQEKAEKRFLGEDYDELSTFKWIRETWVIRGRVC